MTTTKGVLYIVATPIGNLKDITLRAIEVLKKVDRIAVEDTRHAGLLLKHFSINKPTISLHDFNEQQRLGVILDYLTTGQSIALISDAGTPLISDPGFQLVREATQLGFSVIPIPGACAAIAALSVSGLATDKFIFEGFLPAKKESCENHLKQLRHETRTIIFYEAPHRLLQTIEVMCNVFGAERKAVIARELTKLHESVISSTLSELKNYFLHHDDELKGEMVLLVSGIDEKQVETREVLPEQVLDTLLEVLPVKQAASLTSKITGARKNTLYELALQKKNLPKKLD